MYNFAKPSKDPYNFSLTSKPTPKQTPSNPLSKTTAPTTKSTSSKSKMVSTDFQPQRFGINYNPPTIVLEYLQPGNGKLYHHKMKMHKLKKDTPTKHALEYLKKKHYQYFFGNKLPEDQLIQLIEKLKKRLASQPQQQQRPNTASTAGGTINVSTKGQSMFRPPQQMPEEEEEEEDDEYYGDDYEDDEEGMDEETYKKIYSQMGYDKLNMNKLSNEELQQHKAIMETMYSKNSVKPGDAGFMYDIQKNFQPQLDNEWDMEDDDYDIV